MCDRWVSLSNEKLRSTADTIAYRTICHWENPAVNTRFLDTLVCFARLGSFSETARHLHTTQAAVSQRIAALEEELGAVLIDRSPRGGRLTPIGERVRKRAEQLLSLEEDLRKVVRPDAPPAGRVRIGAIESVVHTWLPAHIRALAQHFPDIDPDLTVDTARNLREHFRQHRLDLLIQNDPLEESAGNEELVVAELCRLPIRWIGRPDLPLPRRRLELDDLKGLPLLTFSRTSSPCAHLRALFTGGKIEPRISSFPSVAAILRLALDGFGLAAIPPLFVRPELERGALVPYRGPDLPPMTITAIHARAASPAVKAVVATTQEVVAAYCRNAGARWATCLLANAAPAETKSRSVRAARPADARASAPGS